MEQKKELTKIALAALILASSTTLEAGQKDSLSEGTYLAAGCAAHGCNNVGDSPSNQTATPSNQVENRPMVTKSSSTLTDAQLLGMLNDQGRKIFMGLDPEGKALAIQLASQEVYKDKNLAVKEAQRRMNERRSGMNQ